MDTIVAALRQTADALDRALIQVCPGRGMAQENPDLAIWAQKYPNEVHALVEQFRELVPTL